MITETPMERYRHDTWDTKEPETIAWIQSFNDGDVFFDVGANIGIYSLFCAATHPNCNILAFEPHQANFFRLLDNIKLNGFDNITPFMYCVGDKTGHMDFTGFSDEVGSTGGQMSESGEVGELACWSLDDFIIHGFYSPNPNHIKIDIDGQELAVILGMKETLKSPALKSILVEIDKNNSDVSVLMYLLFMQSGFTTDNRFNKMKNHSRVRRAKEKINVENIVFTRS